MELNDIRYKQSNTSSALCCDSINKEPPTLTLIIMTEEEERNRLSQFKSWHDEAYLYINQAITQEKPNIDRKDVALMMYQKGLGLVDLALCVDTEVT